MCVNILIKSEWQRHTHAHTTRTHTQHTHTHSLTLPLSLFFVYPLFKVTQSNQAVMLHQRRVKCTTTTARGRRLLIYLGMV